MENPSIWPLIARVLNGEATNSEQQQLAELLSHDESLLQQYDLLSRIWKEKQGSGEQDNKEDIESAVSRIIRKAEDESTPAPFLPAADAHKSLLRRLRPWMAAASVLLLVVASWLVLNRKNDDAPAPRAEQIEARKGSRSKSILPDGTTVWLNAGSKLVYENDFSGATREVKLEGEAFFDVVKQPERPFIVHTSGIAIKVLGTAFNVKAYPEDKNVETTLYRGAVKVFRQEESEQKAVQLRPNEKLVLAKEAQATVTNMPAPANVAEAKEHAFNFIISKIDSTKKEDERFETAWVYSRLEFRGDDFEELARKMERWYNVVISFSDDEVKKLRFNGSFENETVVQAMAALKLALPFTYEIKGHEINIGSLK
jgi:ferric-dicitrate binding protein FerR (iron transport regulator)